MEALEVKGCPNCSNRDRVVVIVVIRIENHNHSRRDADVICHLETKEAFYMSSCIRLTPFTECEVTSIYEARNISPPLSSEMSLLVILGG
jgi:hypothetical protein